MRIAVLSGKGGTGKTFVSVNLAAAAEQAIYIDCDVEEPNGHLFFKPENQRKKDVSVCVPVWVQQRCSGCRLCVDFCKFNALVIVDGKIVVFEDVCHACGGCVLFCPTKAMTEKQKPIGHTMEGDAGSVTIKSGMLIPGEESGVPIIRKLLQAGTDEANGIEIIDCPPGSACTVMESIRSVDYCLLVAEPTFFGLHNLQMVLELVRLFGKQYSVMINKSMGKDDPVSAYCERNNIDILMRIPFDKTLGEINAQGEIAVNATEQYRDMFKSLLNMILEEVRHEAIADTQR